MRTCNGIVPFGGFRSRHCERRERKPQDAPTTKSYLLSPLRFQNVYSPCAHSSTLLVPWKSSFRGPYVPNNSGRTSERFLAQHEPFQVKRLLRPGAEVPAPEDRRSLAYLKLEMSELQQRRNEFLESPSHPSTAPSRATRGEMRGLKFEAEALKIERRQPVIQIPRKRNKEDNIQTCARNIVHSKKNRRLHHPGVISRI